MGGFVGDGGLDRKLLSLGWLGRWFVSGETAARVWTVVALEERRGPVVEGKGKGRKGEEKGEEKTRQDKTIRLLAWLESRKAQGGRGACTHKQERKRGTVP